MRKKDPKDTLKMEYTALASQAGDDTGKSEMEEDAVDLGRPGETRREAAIVQVHLLH